MTFPSLFLTAIPWLEAPYFHIAVRKNDWGNRLLQFYRVNWSILLYSREISCGSFSHAPSAAFIGIIDRSLDSPGTARGRGPPCALTLTARTVHRPGPWGTKPPPMSEVYIGKPWCTGPYRNSNWLFWFRPKTNRKYLPVPNLGRNRAKFAILKW